MPDLSLAVADGGEKERIYHVHVVIKGGQPEVSDSAGLVAELAEIHHPRIFGQLAPLAVIQRTVNNVSAGLLNQHGSRLSAQIVIIVDPEKMHLGKGVNPLRPESEGIYRAILVVVIDFRNIPHVSGFGHPSRQKSLKILDFIGAGNVVNHIIFPGISVIHEKGNPGIRPKKISQLHIINKTVNEYVSEAPGNILAYDPPHVVDPGVFHHGKIYGRKIPRRFHKAPEMEIILFVVPGQSLLNQEHLFRAAVGIIALPVAVAVSHGGAVAVNDKPEYYGKYRRVHAQEKDASVILHSSSTPSTNQSMLYMT